MSEGHDEYILSELAELRAQIVSLEAQLAQSGSRDSSPSLEGRVDTNEKAIGALERKWAALRGQDGVDINRNVIGYSPNIENRQTAILTLCVNGLPGYVVVYVAQPPTPF